MRGAGSCGRGSPLSFATVSECPTVSSRAQCSLQALQWPIRMCESARVQLRHKTSDKLAARYRHGLSVTATAPTITNLLCAGHQCMRTGRCESQPNTTLKRPRRPGRAADPSAPDLSFLTRDPAAALQSFYDTIDRIARRQSGRRRAAAGAGRQGAAGSADGRRVSRAAGAQAAGAPAGTRRRRGDRLLPEAEAVPDARRNPPAGDRLPAAVRSRARRRGRRRARRARARPGVHGRARTASR